MKSAVTFLGDLRNNKNIHFFFLTEDHMGLNISKCYSYYNFHLISTTLRGTLGVLQFLEIYQMLQKYILKLGYGSQWEVLSCEISNAQLIVERKGRRF